MAWIRNGSLVLAMGLCLFGAATVATPAPGNLADDDRQIYTSTQNIAQAQAILQYAGYLAPGTYRSGEADESTVVAIQSFQGSHRLRRTGSLDYETRTQILSHAGTLDSDQDRVADTLDRCPGTRPGVWVDTQGCPESTERTSLFDGRERLVLEGVQFDTNTARLTSASRVILGRVARSLNAWPEARVQVDGHTDSVNTDAYNLRLSRERSAAVSEYLVHKGVASSRLQEKGFGESHPIADNTTVAGRATNRRVELVRID